jgi:hypothetical protein
VTQWVLAAIVVGVVLAVNWDAFVRGKRGAARAWSLSAGVAAAVAGILQGAGADRPWPLVALVVFIVLQVVAIRVERRMESTHGS